MIEFEVSGELRTLEDVCYSLEMLIDQIRSGYTSGECGEISWSTSGNEEDTCICGEVTHPHYHCIECDCVLSDSDDLDPEERICNSCYKSEEFDEDEQ